MTTAEGTLVITMQESASTLIDFGTKIDMNFVAGPATLNGQSNGYRTFAAARYNGNI